MNIKCECQSQRGGCRRARARRWGDGMGRIVAGIVLFTAAASARANVWSYKIVQITSNGVTDAPPEDVNAHGDVVWRQAQGPGSSWYDVMLYADGAVTQITDTPDWTEWSPRINDSRYICYGRNDDPAYEFVYSEVWLYTPLDGNQRISPPPTYPTDSHWQPEINNLGEVAWHFSDSFSVPTDIFLYRDETPVNITTTGGVLDQGGPQINDDTWVVWEGESAFTLSSEIYLYAEGTTTPLTTNSYLDTSPRINSAGQVVWEKKEEEAQREIMLWDNGTTTQLTNDAFADNLPVISDSGAVAWLKSAGGNDDVWAYFPGQGVVQITDTPASEDRPQINARNEIVYHRWDGGDNEVFVWGGGVETQLTDNDADDNTPVIGDSGVIAWRWNDGYDDEIVMAVPCAHGDHDCDGDIDLDDFAYFPGCMTGPDGGPVADGCEPFDFEPDDDVDLADFSGFQVAFTGPL